MFRRNLARLARSKRVSGCQVRCFSAVINPTPKPGPIGLLKQQFGSSQLPRVSMTTPYVAVDKSKHHNPIQKGAPQITALPNGLKVVTVDFNTAASTVAVLVDAGSRYEPIHLSGISNFLNHLSLGTTMDNSSYMISQTLARHGISISSSVTKESTLFVANSLRQHVPLVMDVLSDNFFRPLFPNDELTVARGQYDDLVKEIEEHGPDASDLIHLAAYGHSTLGMSVNGHPRRLEIFERLNLAVWADLFWTPSRMVIAGLGVDHAELVKLAESNFGHTVAPASYAEEAVAKLPPKAQEVVHELRKKEVDITAKKKAKYIGSDLRSFKEAETTHIALGFESPSWDQEADVYATCVLQQLMGGGESFSAGGPGKGMHSRLYRNVLNQHEWALAASANNGVYSDSGLFYLYGHTSSRTVRPMLKALVNEARGMASVTAEEVERAKNQLQNNVLMQMEARDVTVEDLARQVQLFGKVEAEDRMIHNVRKVTVQDVQRVASKMLASKPSLAIHGNVVAVPPYEQVVAALQAPANA